MGAKRRFALACLVILAVGGCGGGSQKPRPDKTPVQIIRQSPEPLLLRYHWQESGSRVYRFTNVVPSKSGGTGLEQDFEVSCQGDAKGENARVEGRLLKIKTLLFGASTGEAELEPLAFSAQVDTRGRLSSLRQTTGEDTLSFLETGEVLLDSHIFGFPAGVFVAGVFNCCLLPEQKVKIGDSWTESLPLPGPNIEKLSTQFSGKLLELQKSGNKTFAIIEMKIAVPKVAEPYVAKIRFDLDRGEVARIDWLAVPGAEGNEARQELIP